MPPRFKFPEGPDRERTNSPKALDLFSAQGAARVAGFSSLVLTSLVLSSFRFSAAEKPMGFTCGGFPDMVISRNNLEWEAVYGKL